MNICESVVIDEVLGVGGSDGKGYTVVYYEGEALFFWVSDHWELSVVIERTEVLGGGKVCFLYVGNVYIVLGKEVE